MKRRPIEEYRLSPAARNDLSGIWDHTALMWSQDQADAYLRGLDKTLDALCDHPEIARERTGINPPVRLHPYRSHLIIYRIEGDHLAIIRIVHCSQNWRALLND